MALPSYSFFAEATKDRFFSGLRPRFSTVVLRGSTFFFARSGLPTHCPAYGDLPKSNGAPHTGPERRTVAADFFWVSGDCGRGGGVKTWVWTNLLAPHHKSVGAKPGRITRDKRGRCLLAFGVG